MTGAVPDPNLVGKGEWTHLAVPPGCQCPECREWRPDLLVWIDDDTVECETWGTQYQPATGKVSGPADAGIEPEGGNRHAGQ